MSNEEAREILANEGLELVSLLKQYDNAALFLCKEKNGTEIEAVIQDGNVIVAPT